MDPSKLKVEFLNIIPKLSFELHKGQAGRIAIVGGCKYYTGAPYFAAISALKVGCDLSYVFCNEDASLPIKSYNPDLIVYPILDQPSFHSEIPGLVTPLHSLVIGPGLGREEKSFQSIRKIIDIAKEKSLPIVFDADALFYLNNNFDVVSNYSKAILTPNKIEFERLYKSVTNKTLDHAVNVKDVEDLASSLGHVTIVRKGPSDIITDGHNTVCCSETGSPRRCGGQGDVLSGAMGTFNYWAHNYAKSISCNATILAAFGACLLTRRCSYLAYQKFKRSTLTSNLIDEIDCAFTKLFPTE